MKKTEDGMEQELVRTEKELFIDSLALDQREDVKAQLFQGQP